MKQKCRAYILTWKCQKFKYCFIKKVSLRNMKGQNCVLTLKNGSKTGRALFTCTYCKKIIWRIPKYSTYLNFLTYSEWVHNNKTFSLASRLMIILKSLDTLEFKFKHSFHKLGLYNLIDNSVSIHNSKWDLFPQNERQVAKSHFPVISRFMMFRF